MKIMYNDPYDLIVYICNAEDDLEEFELEDLLYEKYEINIDNFIELINVLLPLCHRAFSPLSENLYCGFADKDRHMWLMKQVTNE